MRVQTALRLAAGELGVTPSVVLLRRWRRERMASAVLFVAARDGEGWR
jgi:hypothetical protein